MLMKRLPIETNIDFMSVRMIAFAISGLAIILSLALIPMRGLNFGIDFAGGTLVEISAPEGVETEDIRSSLTDLNLKDLQVTSATGTGANAQEIFVIRAATSDDGVSASTSEEGEAPVVSGEADLVVATLQEVFPQGSGD